MLKFWAGLTAGVTLICAGYALASRNSSGTMSAANGPYVTGTTINSTLANARFADIETEITDSLDRSGKGGMLAAVRGIDGTVAAPAFSFTSETGSGLYRIGASDLGWAISGGKKLELTSTLFAVTPNATFSGTLGIGAAATNPLDVTVSGSASTTAATFLEASLADGNSLTEFFGKATSGGGTGILTYTKNATAANSTFCLGVFSGAANTLCVDGNDKVLSHSLTIGATGTAISARFRGTTSWTPGSIAASTSAVKAITMTGAAAGADCYVTPPNAVGAFTHWCVVTADTCTITIYNTLASGPSSGASGTWSCVVENP